MSPHPTRKQLAFSLAGLALAPVVTLYATQVVWLESLWAPLPWMATHGKAVGLFWLLFSSLSFTLYGLFRRLFPACLPEVAVFMGVAVTSRYKMNINGTPLQLSDFTFVENLGEVTGYATAQLIPSLTMILGIAIAAVLTETLRRKETWRPSRRAGLLVSAAGVALLLAALLPGAPLQKAALALDQDSADQSARNQQAGVVLGIYTAWAQRVEVIQAEGNAQAAQLADTFRKGALAPGAAASEGTPDIIFITSESFFDVTRLPGITFEEDPLPNFHRLAEASTNGWCLSNNYGNGTGNVEMEMFTGLSSSLLREGDTLTTLDEGVYAQLPTTVRQLKQAGYATEFVHAHTNELYNRVTTHPAIGFDTVDFLEDFLTQGEACGPYLYDLSFAQELIARYDTRDPTRPLFLYGLSMENHQPYNPEKYGVSSGFPAQSDLLS